jgi:trehalose 6-phosphate phosphatase
MDHTPPPLDCNRHALLLDFDGTFVEFAPRPQDVRVPAGGIDLLAMLDSCFGRAFALVSGRRIADLDGFVRPLVLNAVGVHGQEFRRVPGTVQLRQGPPSLPEARRRLVDEVPRHPGIRLEDKDLALVLHYRGRPDCGPAAARIAASAIAGFDDLEALPGHAIVEVRERGVGKADAVRLAAGWPPFAGRLPVFVGDDTTDEDGFAAAAAAGGFGVKVGPGATVARYRLTDVAAVHAWLAASLREPDRADPVAVESPP